MTAATEPFMPKLGWVQGPDDPRTLRLSAYTADTLPTAPKSQSWMKKASRWPLLGNDRIGDCVLVSCAHLVQGWTAYSRDAESLVAEADVIGAYSAITGYDPKRTSRDGSNPTDRGTNSLAALNFWRRTGIGGHKISAYMKLDPSDHNEVRNAANLFGGIYIAAQLPLAANDQFRAGKTWTATGGQRGRRGSWGGHAMHLGAYGTTGYTVSTWGRTQALTVGWWNTYVDEAFAVVSEDWLNQLGGTNPLGFDLTAMLADLRRVTAA